MGISEVYVVKILACTAFSGNGKLQAAVVGSFRFNKP
jgi:hypothetical protein